LKRKRKKNKKNKEKEKKKPGLKELFLLQKSLTY